MAINRDYVGRVFPASAPYEVSRVKIAEFADAIGDPNPVYRDTVAATVAGHPDVVAPPTFPVVVTQRAQARVMFDPELGLDYSRVVHGDQSFAYTRPVVAGDRLVAVATVDAIRSAAGNDLLSLRAEVSTADGEHVCTARSTVVARGTAEG